MTRGVLDPLLLTPEEAATVLRIGRTAVFDLMRSQRLESVKVGSSRRVPVAALTRFIERLQDEAA